jgi:hypothetical protein
MKCPECGHDTYTSRGGFEICPSCGYGSPTVAEQRRKFEEYKRSLIEGPADRLYSKDAWKLKIVYKARGSKNEGPHGVLCKDNQMVDPLKLGIMIKTDLGTLRYYAHFDEEQDPWEVTGWNFADKTLILTSFGDRMFRSNL